MADRIVVMNGGRIEQIGTPEDVYDRPRSRFVARFIGATNVIDGTHACDEQAGNVGGAQDADPQWSRGRCGHG